MPRKDSWTPAWCCDKLVSHHDVVKAEPAGDNLIQLTVNGFDSGVSVATMSQQVVSAVDLPECCHHSDVQFLLNIPNDAIFKRDVIDLSASIPFGTGSLGDLYTAINEKNLRSYIPKEVRFILRGLRQHNSVSRIERPNNRTYLVHRHQLGPLRILALNEYDLTADAVRDGLDKFGGSDIVLTSNPNCRPSPESIEAARNCGTKVLKWGQLLGALNH